MKGKRIVALALAALLPVLAAETAFAHVTVQPKEVPQGSYQVFTVLVPTERPSATTGVKIVIPDGVEISRFEPKPDWTYETEIDGEGKIVSVTWKAVGAGLGETEFGEFRMQGKVAGDATELVWKAYQTYADGEVVAWTGAPDADTPASVTRVTAAAPTANGQEHGGGGSAEATANRADAARDPLTFGLAVAGLAAGAAALAVALFRGRKA